MKVKVICTIIGACALATILYTKTYSNSDLLKQKDKTTLEQENNSSFKTNVETSNSVNNIENTSNLIKQKIKTMEYTPEKIKELEGNINKEYGIREDILRFIEKEVPSESKNIKEFAIMYAKYMFFIYYRAKNGKEAMNAFRHESISEECMIIEYKKTSDKQGWMKISGGIRELMENTKDRNQYMWTINDKYFKGVSLDIANDLSSKKLEEICEIRGF